MCYYYFRFGYTFRQGRKFLNFKNNLPEDTHISLENAIIIKRVRAVVFYNSFKRYFNNFTNTLNAVPEPNIHKSH